MLDILAIISPLFAVIAIGFIAVRLDMFSKADIRVLGRFVIQFALPALLFKALAERSFGEIMNLDYLAAYALGSLAALMISAAGVRFIHHAPKTATGMVAVGAALSNSGFIGFPVVLQFLGPQAAVALALSMLVENLLVLPISLAIAESGQGKGRTRLQTMMGILGGLSRNPLILAIVAGVLCSLLQIRLPGTVSRVVDMFSQASGAVALFVIGGTLVGLRVVGDLPRIAWVCIGKLVIHPLAVALLFLLFTPADPILRMAGITIASVPMFSVFPIIAQKYDEQSWCASALLVATVTSFITMSSVIWLVSHTIPSA